MEIDVASTLEGDSLDVWSICSCSSTERCRIQQQYGGGIFHHILEYQLADLFTKALPVERFQYLVRRLGMRCLTPAELEALVNESA
nr:ribonuclease H-like domain-containing protein [Tanacetum cinerariifolium]